MNLKRCGNSFTFAWHGLGVLWQQEQNFRIHIAISVAVLTLALWLKVSTMAWAVLWLTIGAMLAVEALNTAIERTVDLAIGTILHPLAKHAKDLAAAGCLLMALASVGVGLAVFGPYLLRLLP